MENDFPNCCSKSQREVCNPVKAKCDHRFTPFKDLAIATGTLCLCADMIECV